jgi:anti-sigma factor RsiW
MASMNHDLWTDRLSDYLDDELPLEEKRSVDEHLAGCAECHAVLAELRSVAERAGSLRDAPPDRDLWPGVAAGIGAPLQAARVLELRPARRFSFTLPQLVAASLALIVLSGGMVWIARIGGDRTDFPATAAYAPAPEPAAVAVPVARTFADAHYDEAIADLQQTLDAGRERLDADTIRVLEQNLVAIDRAIEQCRNALAADPANLYLSEHLVAAKKRKLALLRRATAIADEQPRS